MVNFLNITIIKGKIGIWYIGGPVPLRNKELSENRRGACYKV